RDAVTEQLSEEDHRAIVIGYGPIGQMVVRLLLENNVKPTVVELNHETVNELNKQGVRAIYGDASQRSILERAGAKEARSLVFAASGSPGAVVSAARELNPELVVLARATYAREVPIARKAGARVVVVAEAEVALAMAEHLLTHLGASPEQLDMAR